MVLLGYLQRPPLLCEDDALQSGTSRRWSKDETQSLARRVSLFRNGGILGSATRIATLLNDTVLQLRDGLTAEQRALKAKKEEQCQILRARMKNAETLEQWASAAKELDILEDNEAWKYIPDSPEFDVSLIEARLKQSDEARTNCDVKQMMNLVRTSLARDLGDMGNLRLYKHSHIGTKDLIERYIDSIQDTIRALVDMSKHSLPDGLETKDILEQVVYARQAFGRSALLLSGGATFGMNHIGVLKALFEARLLPRIISGTSAGSIVCAVLCTHTDEEIPAVLAAFPYGDLSVFEETGNEDSVLERIRRLLTEGAWIDIKHLTRVMQQLLGDLTFQEAYNRSRRILNITVSPASAYELPRLLNYVTSPNILIWSAVAASCSVPVLFSAAQLLVKDPLTGENTPWNPTPQRWIDGSVDNDLPMTRLAEMFNVNHFVVSQVNPHVVPFLARDEEAIAKDAQTEGFTGQGLIHSMTNLAKEEVLHRMHMMAELGIFPNMVTKARSILSQKYSGDITILPDISYKDFPRILKNPTPEFMVHTCLCGERATWPKLSRIRNHCAIELELDAAVQQLRARVVFSPSQVDLRRMSAYTSRGTLKKLGKKRRDSNGNARAIQSPGDRDEDIQPHLRFTPSKPQRTYSSQALRRVPTLTPAHAETPISPFAFSDSNHRRHLSQQNADISSAEDTGLSLPTSDADIESGTDDSSPELSDSGTAVPGLGIYPVQRANTWGAVDYFSSSQPVTPGTDHVLATSPMLTMSRVDQQGGQRSKSVTEPSTPELKYKRLFHGGFTEREKVPN